MLKYRLYRLDEDARISTPPVIIECLNDEEATQKARDLAADNDIEIWRGTHLVALIPRR